MRTHVRVLILAFLVSSVAAFAQVVGGTIAGVVTDKSGAAVPAADITLHNEETGAERHYKSGGDGGFTAPSLPVGVYSVTVNAKDFTPLHRTGVSLTVGQALSLNLALDVGQLEQTVSVVDKPAVVDVSTQETQGLVNERQVKDLPLNGRSFDQLIQLNPASVNYTTQRSGGVGTSNSSVGNMFSVSGRRPQENLYLLNGIEYTGASLINNTPGGTSGQLLGVDAVREFNVVSDTYGANYGKRPGGQISIVTASGTNTLHGSVYEFLRNSALDARNYFDQANIPEFQRNNYGAAAGGPLKRDKLFLFGNYEGYRQNLGLSDVTLVPDAASRAKAVPSVQPLLALWPVANGPELGGGIAEAFSNPPQHVREDFGTSRFDANLGPKDSLFAVYTVDDSDATTPSANPYSGIYESLRAQVASVQEQRVITSNLLNTFRFGYSRAAYFFTGQVSGDVPGWVAGAPVGAIVIAGSTASNGASQVTLAGANTGSNNSAVRNLFTVDDHIFWTKGKHQIEAGGWIQRLQANDNLAQNQFGQASFSTLNSFLAGTVATYTVVPSPTALGWRSFEGAGYLEDTWKVVPRVQVRIGFRSESTNGWNEAQNRAANYGFTNGVINSTPFTGSSALTKNRATFLPEPRVGLAWDVFGNGTTAVRAGFGVHRALLDNLDYRLDQTAPFNTTLSLKNVAVANLQAVSVPGAEAGGQVSPSNVQPDIYTPTVLAWDLHIEQQITRDTSLTVGYVGSHGYHQILSEDQNEPASVVCPQAGCPAGLAAGTIYFPTTTKANPNVANTTSWVSQGDSSYNALEVDARRQFAHGLQLRGVYTWAQNLDDGSAWNTSVSANTPAFVEFPGRPALDYGPAATNIRHAGAINGTWDIPYGDRLGDHRLRAAAAGWSLSGIATLQSGFPFSPQLGYNTTGNGDTRNPVRPDLNANFNSRLYPHTVSQWFDPAAFSAPASGAIGNLGRDTMVGPGLKELDLSATKTTVIHDRFRAQFRAEFFNILNHSNFTTPNAVVYSSGPTPTTPTASPVASSTGGVITATSTTSRQIQFGLKLLF
ncbi:carboxypeptidase regulatory-like domain-containing protein [Silvibacterium acidisoli]|uniref:carboxypeptidase regulatory-like domain-containing protein n=1 Tax=Acidobacteriaceae bacterium ZG23-2 TaxID=2883246 RepID=UPI00406CE787